MNADKEAEREAGEKALWALVSLGWLWLQDTHPGRQARRTRKRKIWLKIAFECKEEELQEKGCCATEVWGPAAIFIARQDD